MDAITVEFQRFGDDSGVLRRSDQYIRTVGSFAPAEEDKLMLEQADLDRGMKTLDYENYRGAKPTEAENVRKNADRFIEQISEVLTNFLPTDPAENFSGGCYQVEVVTRAKELAQLPFEVLAPEGKCIITRRVRQPWPRPKIVQNVEPKVLFAWADPRQSVPHETHMEALDEVLQDWGGVKKAATVLENATLASLKAALQVENENEGYTHVHLLAHGVKPENKADSSKLFNLHEETPPPSTLLSLHGTNGKTHRCTPEDLASIFAGDVPRPASFTLATCHGAEIDPIEAGGTFAHMLHTAGVPVVVASQLALTQHGSHELIRTFLKMVVEGEDPRKALGACREAMRKDKETYYDWIALTGYLDVSEDLEKSLPDRQFEAALNRMRKATKGAEAHANNVLSSDAPRKGIAAESTQIRAGFDSVRQSLLEKLDPKLTKGQTEELHGLLGSSQKREAEAMWKLSEMVDGSLSANLLQQSRVALKAAADAYGKASVVSRDHHWTAVQSLVLKLIIQGGLSGSEDDWTVAAVAAKDTVRRLEEKRDNDPGDKLVFDAAFAHGSLAELHLITSGTNGNKQFENARRHLDKLVHCIQKLEKTNTFPITSTLDQLDRYDNWWSVDEAWKLPENVVTNASALRNHLKIIAADLLEESS